MAYQNTLTANQEVGLAYAAGVIRTWVTYEVFDTLANAA